MTGDDAVLAPRQRQTARPHGLNLAVAHTRQVGAHHVAGGLQHALFEHERFGVEARSPGKLRARETGDRRVHAAHFDPDLGDRGVDQGSRRAGEAEMLTGLRDAVDAHVEMKQLGIDRRGKSPGRPVLAKDAVVRGRPDRDSTAFSASPLQQSNEAFTPSAPTIATTQTGIGRAESIALAEKGSHLRSGGKDIGREDGNVA